MATNTVSLAADFDSASDNVSTASYRSDTSYNTPKKYKCDYCNRKFARLFTLRRHKKTIHDEESSDESSEESDMSVDENDSNTESSDDERSSEEDSNDEEEENYPTSMFEKLVRQTINKHEDELSVLVEDMTSKNLFHKEAMKRALLSSKDALKTLQRLYAQNMIDIIEHRRHPLYKAILYKVKELQDDGFSLSEAITSAVSYRKHAIHNLVKFI